MNKSKRTTLVPVLVAAFFVGAFSWTALYAQVAENQSSAEAKVLLKTYELKYISIAEFMQSAKLFVLEYSGTENALTVRIFSQHIPEFEALLKKLDVEKKDIQFQVFTIIASKETPAEQIKDRFITETQGISDKELRRVLDEMKGLWNFKYYSVDSPSFLIVKDGSGRSTFRLVSDRYNFVMDILHVSLRGDKPGSRIISLGQIQLNQSYNTPESQTKSTLLDTSDVTLKENGYLVVGVSGFTSGWSGLALILVIRAEIK